MASHQFSPGLPERPALLRQLGLVSATALVIANMVGTGIFTTTGFLAGDLGSPKIVLLIWVVGAVVALAGALCYSELGINFPSSGGEYVYLTQAYGPTWGFITGWISFFAGFSAPVAAAALACSDYLGYFFPSLKQSNPAFVLGAGSWSLNLGGAQTVACTLVVIFTVLNCTGVKATARVQNFLTATKLLVIVAFIGLGFAIGTGDWRNFSLPARRTSLTPLEAQFAISLFYIYMSYSGWNAATYVAEEIRHPARTLPRALAAGTGLVALLYVALNAVFIYGAPLESLKGVVAVGSLAASRLFSPAISGVFSALMALSLLSTVNAMVTVGPRVYYAMAKNGAFFPIAARIHPRFHTPAIAILCQGLCTMLMTLTPFAQLLVYIGFTLNFFASMSVASLFLFRRRPGWQKLRVVSFAWPLIPGLFVLVGLWITLFGLWLQPRVSGAAVLTVVTGAVVYHFRHRR
ncbi:MAG: amino acid permease [Bryobacteraceae bacterium]